MNWKKSRNQKKKHAHEKKCQNFNQEMLEKVVGEKWAWDGMRLQTPMGKCILFLKEKNFGEIVKSEMIDTLTKDFRSKLLKSNRGGHRALKELEVKKKFVENSQHAAWGNSQQAASGTSQQAAWGNCQHAALRISSPRRSSLRKNFTETSTRKC